MSEAGVSNRFEAHLQLETAGFFCVSFSPSGLGWQRVDGRNACVLILIFVPFLWVVPERRISNNTEIGFFLHS